MRIKQELLDIATTIGSTQKAPPHLLHMEVKWANTRQLRPGLGLVARMCDAEADAANFYVFDPAGGQEQLIVGLDTDPALLENVWGEYFLDVFRTGMETLGADGLGEFVIPDDSVPAPDFVSPDAYQVLRAIRGKSTYAQLADDASGEVF